MNDFIFRLLENSLLLSAAILLLTAAGKFLHGKTSPGLRYFAWLLVAAGLLIPYRPTLYTVPVDTADAPRAVREVAEMVDFTRLWFETGMNAQAGPQSATAAELLIKTSEANALAPTRGTDRVSALKTYGIFALWAAGVFIGLLICITRHFRFLRMIKTYSRPEVSLRALSMTEEIRRRIKLKRRVRLWVCPMIPTPVMFGLLKPVIVFPDVEIENDTRYMMILHEALHIKRGDLFAKLFVMAAATAHWFNPFTYLMSRMLTEESERACDREVIEYAGHKKRREYGNILLFTAKQSGLMKNGLAFALTGGGKRLKKRIQKILETAKPRKSIVFSLTALLMAGVILSGGVVAFGGRNSVSAASTAENPAESEKTITIAHLFTPVEIEALSRKYMETHPGVTIRINDFGADYYRYITEVPTLLMSGGADDLMPGYVNYKDPAVTRYMADFNELMDADPTFNRDDYYSNVFEAMEYNGGLYIYPLNVRYDTLAINAKLTGPAREKYDAMDALSYFDMFEIHQMAEEGFPYSDYTNAVYPALLHTIDSFLDLENKTCDFDNPKFIGLLKSAAETKDSATDINGASLDLPLTAPADVKLYSEKYTFLTAPGDIYQHTLPVEGEILFTGRKPLTDEEGSLLTFAPIKYTLSAASQNKDLAWDFLRFMEQPESYADGNGNNILSIPFLSVNKNLNPAGLEYGEVLSMPMRDQHLTLMPANVQDVFNQIVHSYTQGLITAEQCASELQSKVKRALRE
ncbi:MAG: extracellular solute-binding protein [Clostridiales bacterium]|nr:extracellular solute-binding protein [Clostridiales bacterium]